MCLKCYLIIALHQVSAVCFQNFEFVNNINLVISLAYAIVTYYTRVMSFRAEMLSKEQHIKFGQLLLLDICFECIISRQVGTADTMSYNMM